MKKLPTFAPIWLACQKCGYSWHDRQPQGVLLATWAAHVSTYRCPHCGADQKDVLLRTTPLEAGAP